MTTVAAIAVPDASAVLAALDAVRDPELDEPVTSLGFVASCTVTAAGVAEVRLRLPTYFCAKPMSNPNNGERLCREKEES